MSNVASRLGEGAKMVPWSKSKFAVPVHFHASSAAAASLRSCSETNSVGK